MAKARVLLRPFTKDDVHEAGILAEDWARAPGPAFDKWPTELDAVAGLVEHFACSPDRYLAMLVEDRVVGLISLNGIEADQTMDLGYVIRSDHQDDDLDREALRTAVNLIFDTTGAAGITTRNTPHEPQQAPLVSLGFRKPDASVPGVLSLRREAWRGSDE